ncbi:MAG: hypothetical protein EXR90_07460 [Methyloglobulus sp.]|nr:hypothetical protein [Methyloglobulus sp.]
MSDPYKWVNLYISPGVGTPIQEKRPRERFEWAWLTQQTHKFIPMYLPLK